MEESYWISMNMEKLVAAIGYFSYFHKINRTFGDFDDNVPPSFRCFKYKSTKGKTRKGIVIYITTCGSDASGERA